MNTRNSYGRNDHLVFADRDTARVVADLRALGAPEFAEAPQGRLRRLLHGRRHLG